MQKEQNFSFSVKQTNSQTTLLTVGQLDEVMDNRKTINETINRNVSSEFLVANSHKIPLQKYMYEVSNEVLAAEAKQNPFMLRKLHLALKTQLKLIQAQQNPYYRKFIPDTIKCTSYREEVEGWRIKNGKKMRELCRVLNLTP